MDDGRPRATVYTDGGCRPNPGPGAWAAVILREGREPLELVGSEPGTTNNQMELMAAIRALAALEEPHDIELHTDSEYLRRGITEWLPRWRASGWKTAGKQDVKNRDLWEELSRELARHRVRWHWVKGHSGDRWNERVDELASNAIPGERLPVDDPGAVHVALGVASSSRLGKGAWAAVLRYGDREKVIYGVVPGGTGNRLHLVGAVRALEALRRPCRVHLYTVSDYLKDGATTWIHGWRRRGWTTRDGRPVAHRDLWQALERAAAHHRVSWHVLGKGDVLDWMDRAKAAAQGALAGG